MKVALATKNAGKVREIAVIVAPAGVELVGPADDWIPPEESESDYRGNALLKARSLVDHMRIPCLADDSGIEVESLDWGPGPRSARFAGEGATDDQNLQKLIGLIEPSDVRGARYRCVAVLIPVDGEATITEETVEGTLITERRGGNGFGYDPIFVPVGDTRTMAELTPVEKDAISHRGKAFRALVPALQQLSQSV